jgi:hypothetical protein
LSEVWYQWDGGGYKDRVWKYYVLMYENGKRRHFETILGMGGNKGE